MSLAKYLYSSGAEIISPLKYGREREKFSGAMWTGSLIIRYDGIDYYFKMHVHFNGPNAMTDEEVLDNMELSGLRILDYQTTDPFNPDSPGGQYYDAHWYTLVSLNKIYFLHDGWFMNMQIRPFIEEKFNKIRFGDVKIFTEAEEAELYDLGFVVLLELSSY